LGSGAAGATSVLPGVDVDVMTEPVGDDVVVVVSWGAAGAAVLWEGACVLELSGACALGAVLRGAFCDVGACCCGGVGIACGAAIPGNASIEVAAKMATHFVPNDRVMEDLQILARLYTLRSAFTKALV